MVETTIELPPDAVPGEQGREARGERPGETQEQWRVRTNNAASGDPLAPRSPLAPPLSPAENAAQYRAGGEDLIRQQQADEERYRGQRDPVLRELDRADRAPRPAVPHLQNVGPPPDQKQYQQHAMGFVSAMSLVLAFSGRLAGRSATDSLNAFASAANGWREGNAQAYENGFKEWEAANKRILQQNENTLKEYDLILKDRSLKREEIMDRLKIASIKHYDDQMYNATLKGNLELAYKLRDIQYKATTDLATALQPFQRGFAEANARKLELANKYEEMEQNGWVDPTTGQPYISSKTGQPYTDAEKAAAKHHMERFPPGSTIDAEGNIKYPGVGGRKMGELELWQLQNPGKGIEEYWKAKAQSRPPRNAPAIFIQKFMEENPEAKSPDVRRAMAVYNATQSRMRTLGTREANALVAINEMQKTAVLAQAASDKVPRGPWVPLNEIKQAVARGTSSPEQKAFDDANSAFITAYAQTMSRSGATTVHSQQRAEAVLRTADGPEAYRAGIKMLMAEANAVKEAVADAFEELSGGGGGGGAEKPVTSIPAIGGGDPLQLEGTK